MKHLIRLTDYTKDDVINSSYYVGYEFKKCLLEIQQAILIYSMR